MDGRLQPSITVYRDHFLVLPYKVTNNVSLSQKKKVTNVSEYSTSKDIHETLLSSGATGLQTFEIFVLNNKGRTSMSCIKVQSPMQASSYYLALREQRTVAVHYCHPTGTQTRTSHSPIYQLQRSSPPGLVVVILALLANSSWISSGLPPSPPWP
jgi:hypothetical protein